MYVCTCMHVHVCDVYECVTCTFVMYVCMSGMYECDVCMYVSVCALNVCQYRVRG